MVKRSQSSSEPSSKALATDPSDAAQGGGEAAAPRARRPYQRPQVRKRRSVAEATLFSGTGLIGTLVSGFSGKT